MMHFRQLDQITELQEGVCIQATKTLAPTESYLKDHFPNFPVMPGVLMLEAMYQAAAWLVYKSEDFAHSVVLLKEAKNIKYADFVQPEQTLIVTAEIIQQDDHTSLLKAQATVHGRTAVSGRLVLERSNLVDQDPRDQRIRRELREQFEELYQPASSLEVPG